MTDTVLTPPDHQVPAAFTRARRAMSIFRMGTLPVRAAVINGVSPPGSVVSGSTPASSRRATIAA